MERPLESCTGRHYRCSERDSWTILLFCSYHPSYVQWSVLWHASSFTAPTYLLPTVGVSEHCIDSDKLLADTGENPKWNSTEPYFDSFYCNVRCAFHWSPQCWRKQWDTYRSLYPLMSLHDPVTFSRIVRAMIDIQKHEGTHPVINHKKLLGNWMVLGWLPECRGATAMHSIQGGSSTFSTKTTCLSLILMCSIL